MKIPPIQLLITEKRYHGSFVAPNPWISCAAHSLDGVSVGRVGYGLSPLYDRIYIDGLHIDPEFRRKRYGASLVQAIVNICSTGDLIIPVTPLHIIYSGSEFWHSLRMGKFPGIKATQDLRGSELDEECLRWKTA